MTDDVTPTAEPPFDAVPGPPADPVETEEAPKRPRRRSRRPTVWLAALVIVVLVVGQSIAFVTLFGEKLDRLSTANEKSDPAFDDSFHGSAGAGHDPADVGHAVDPHPPIARRMTGSGTGGLSRLPVHARHTLDFGRDALADGDLQSARVVAASFLLALDGRSESERERESEALALLGQVLSEEYGSTASGAKGGGR